MSKCGYLKRSEKGNIMGEFLSWSFPRINMALRSVKQFKDNSPTHEIIAQNPHGAWVVIGAAWQKEISKGEKAGQHMYSLQLEEPTLFDKPVKLSAFPMDGEADHFQLQYDRSEKPADHNAPPPTDYTFESEKGAGEQVEQAA